MKLWESTKFSIEEWSPQLWRQFMQLRKKPEKNSGLQRDLNSWPRDTGAMLKPTKLWSHWCWELVNYVFICSRGWELLSSGLLFYLAWNVSLEKKAQSCYEAFFFLLFLIIISVKVRKCSFFHTNFQESVHVTQNFLVLIKNRVEWKTPSWAIFWMLGQRFYLNTIYRERKKEEERRKAVIFLK